MLGETFQRSVDPRKKSSQIEASTKTSAHACMRPLLSALSRFYAIFDIIWRRTEILTASTGQNSLWIERKQRYLVVGPLSIRINRNAYDVQDLLLECKMMKQVFCS